MADPARTPPATFEERRKRGRTRCLEIPCLPVQHLLAGRGGYPKCVRCLHEVKILAAVRALAVS